MKKTILLSLTLLVSICAFAQKDDKFDSKIALGIKVGLTFPAFAISGVNPQNITSSALTSFYGGITLDVPLVSVLSVQPGLLLIGQGSSYSTNGSTGKLTPLYLQVPVNLIVGIPAGPGKFLVGAGPYWSWGISGKLKVAGSPDSNLKFGSDSSDNLKSMDWGLNFLVGYQLKLGLAIHAGYGVGLRDIQPSAALDATYKTGVFSAGLGFTF